ncbi:MAG: hypothetical protein AABY79_12415 [Nitrospirota bacterium]
MRYSVALLEQKHRKGYLAKPVKKHEFSPWEDEQVWGDELNGVKSAGTSSSIPIRSGPCSY